MILQHLKKPTTIKAILSILYYVFILFIFSDFILEPIFKNSLEAIFDKNIQDFSKGAKIYINIAYDFIIYMFLFIPLFFLYKFEYAHDYYDARSKGTNFLLAIIIYFAIGRLIEIFAAIISNSIYTEQSTNQDIIDSLLTHSSLSFILSSFTIVIIGPIVEETIFRQCFFDLFKNKYLATIISSICFGAIHILSSDVRPLYLFALLIPYAAAGLSFSIAYEKGNRNIWLPITIHQIGNLLSIIAVILLK